MPRNPLHGACKGHGRGPEAGRALAWGTRLSPRGRGKSRIPGCSVVQECLAGLTEGPCPKRGVAAGSCLPHGPTPAGCSAWEWTVGTCWRIQGDVAGPLSTLRLRSLGPRLHHACRAGASVYTVPVEPGPPSTLSLQSLDLCLRSRGRRPGPLSGPTEPGQCPHGPGKAGVSLCSP